MLSPFKVVQSARLLVQKTINSVMSSQISDPKDHKINQYSILEFPIAEDQKAYQGERKQTAIGISDAFDDQTDSNNPKSDNKAYVGGDGDDDASDIIVSEDEEEEIDHDYIHYNLKQYQEFSTITIIAYVNTIIVLLLKGFLFSSTFTFPIIVSMSGYKLIPSTIYYYIEWILLAISVKYGPIADGALIVKYYVLILGVVVGLPLEFTYISFSVWFLSKLFISVIDSIRFLVGGSS